MSDKDLEGSLATSESEQVVKAQIELLKLIAKMAVQVSAQKIFHGERQVVGAEKSA